MAKFTDAELATFEQLDAALESMRDLSARIAEEATLVGGSSDMIAPLLAASWAASAEVARLLNESNAILSAHGVEL